MAREREGEQREGEQREGEQRKGEQREGEQREGEQRQLSLSGAPCKILCRGPFRRPCTLAIASA